VAPGWFGVLNIDGDGKATGPDMEANTEPSSSIKSTPTRQLGRDDFIYGQFEENLSTACLTKRCALAIATELAKLCSRSHSRASLVTGLASA
jgi:hypothetical protein